MRFDRQIHVARDHLHDIYVASFVADREIPFCKERTQNLLLSHFKVKIEKKTIPSFSSLFQLFLRAVDFWWSGGHKLDSLTQRQRSCG